MGKLTPEREAEIRKITEWVFPPGSHSSMLHELLAEIDRIRSCEASLRALLREVKYFLKLFSGDSQKAYHFLLESDLEEKVRKAVLDG